MAHPPRALARARQLRRATNEVEVELWESLRSRRLDGYRFRRQHPVGPYVLDFYCPSARLGVEVDGSQHVDCAGDRRRDEWLARQGIRVIRFWNHEIADLEQVLQAIADAIAE